MRVLRLRGRSICGRLDSDIGYLSKVVLALEVSGIHLIKSCRSWTSGFGRLIGGRVPKDDLPRKLVRCGGLEMHGNGIGAPTSETSGRIKARLIPWYLLGIKAIEEVAGDTRTV
jgi:hypothetical protein